MAIVAVAEAELFASRLLRECGLTAEQAAAVANILIEGDLLGHSTHGLARLPGYIAALEAGGLVADGAVETIADHGASFAWEANRLPGPWVIGLALAELQKRAGRHPVVTATVADCSHIGCLQAYLRPVVEQGYLLLMMASDPGVRTVAPFGGLDPVLGPNPVAFGIPTSGAPILIDVCTAATSNAAVRTAAAEQRRLPGNWLLDGNGVPTDDPTVVSADPPGTILPLGGSDLGHKGFALGLMVEALALAMSGYGRGNERSPGGQGVFLQLIDPGAFAGRERFVTEISALADEIRSSRPSPRQAGVRLPGERALHGRRSQLETGVTIADRVVASLGALAARYDLPPLAASGEAPGMRAALSR